MSEVGVIAAKVRSEKGSLAARRLRKSGVVPAILYGHNETAVPLAVEELTLRVLLRGEHAGRGLLNLSIDGKQESAVIKDLQWDVFGKEILHVDFARVSKGDKVRVSVPVVLKGQAAGVQEGGVVDHVIHQIDIECPAEHIQEAVNVNIKDLKLGMAIHVKELVLLEGCKALASPDSIVVQVKKHVDESEEGEGLPGEGALEPELIRREKPEEPEE